MSTAAIIPPSTAFETPQTTAIVPYRAFSAPVPDSTVGTVTTIMADAVIEEDAHDEYILTDHPVEAGTFITDHAYKLPAELVLTYVWAAASPQNVGQDYAFLATLYQQLLGLQAQRLLFKVYTGKRQYVNMFIQAIGQTTDKDHENILSVRIRMREVIIATTSTIALGAPIGSITQVALPQQNAPVVPQGLATLAPAPNFNPAVLTP